MTQTLPYCFHEICRIFKITDLNRFLADVPILCDLKTPMFLWCWLSVIIMSRTGFSVNLHSLVCLNVKELLARRRCHIWSLSDSNEIRTHNHLVRKRTLNHIAKLVKSLSVHLRTKWLWVLILLLSLFVVFLGVVK